MRTKKEIIMTLKELSEKFKDYVTIERYLPVEKIVWGFAKLALSAIVIALLGLVIIK
jgi:hypothetical protein